MPLAAKGTPVIAGAAWQSRLPVFCRAGADMAIAFYLFGLLNGFIEGAADDLPLLGRRQFNEVNGIA